MDKLFRRSKSQNDLGSIDNIDKDFRTSNTSNTADSKLGQDLAQNSEKRVRLIGELITLMDSGSPSSVIELDKKLAECFRQYATCTTPTLNPEVENLFLTTHIKLKPITPPTCLKKSTNVTSLDRYTKLERIFRSVPIFDNKDISVRDFLLELHTVVSDLGCDITEAEYKYILLNKLASKIKAVLMASHKSATLVQIYEHLINLYDNTSSERDIFSSLVSGKQNFNSLKEYLEFTLRLLSNIRSSRESTNALLINLKNHLPPRIYDKIVDFIDRYESLKKETPPVEKIINILYSNREAIDKHFNSKGTQKFNEVKLEERCSVCNRTGHNEKTCYKKATCSKCNTMGHTSGYCKQNKPLCSRCGRIGHLTNECRARCRLCNSLTHNSVQCPVYINIEPAQNYCSKCYEQVALKLFHPTNLCRNFVGQKNLH